jgi:hypothetical protein
MNKESHPSEKKTKVKLLLDADVLIHFFKADNLFDLPRIFEENEYILFDVVWGELLQTSIRYAIELLINNGSITLMDFPTSNDLIDYEFDFLRYEGRGMGESACMAYAKYNAQDVIASSNLSDLLPYCHDYGIPYVTTLDFLCSAMKKGIYTEEECDDFIRKVNARNSNIRIEQMKDYDCKARKILKYKNDKRRFK